MTRHIPAVIIAGLLIGALVAIMLALTAGSTPACAATPAPKATKTAAPKATKTKTPNIKIEIDHDCD